MLLKPFEAGRYDEDWIVVNNPVNGKQELFSEREYAVVKFLKQNESQSLLALLMPNIGIAKKNHIEMCLSVLSKLKRMQIADYFAITGRRPSGTNTLELAPQKSRIEFPGLAALAATAYGIAGKALAPLGQPGLLGLVIGLAAFSFAMFPFDSVDRSLADSSPPYALLFLLAYLSACAGLCFRALVRGAFLKGFGREAQEPAVGLLGPFVALSADTSAVNLLGYKARAQMDVIGILAPCALSGFFTVLALGHLLSPATAFVGLAACVATSLLVACPLFSLDGADLLQALLFRSELAEKTSLKLRDIFRLRGSLGKELAISLLAAFVWILVWFDGMHTFRETLSVRLAEDFAGPALGAKVGAGATFAAIVALLCLPVSIMIYYQLRLRSENARKRVTVQKDKVKDSLTFEERIAALEKIPLFAYLNDQERLALLNEMQPVYYRHGDYLVHQGEVGREFFVLVKGQASARYTEMSGKELALAELREGDAFGEIALIDDVPRTASIVSENGCIALVLRKEGFDRFAETLGSADRVKAMVRLTSFFRRHPLFSKLSARDQAHLIDSFRFQTITSGERIAEGDDDFHVIYSGSVRVDTGGADGETTLTNDDCFGYSNPLSARYVALEGTGLLTVAKDEFHNLIWEKLVEKPELFV